MKYRIIEEIDGVGKSVFYAQYGHETLFGRIKWKNAVSFRYDYTTNMAFSSAKEAKQFLLRFHAPKKVSIVDEGEL